jgi:two-component sensor histidine kinase
MILYELVTNSARHVYFEGREGEVRVELSREGAFVKCRVSDNVSVSTKTKLGRGLRILIDLSRSLGGRIRHSISAEGCHFALDLPLTEHEQRANQETAGGARSTGFARKLEDVHQSARIA